MKAFPWGPDPQGQETGALALSSVSRTASGLSLSAFRTYFPSTMKPSGTRNVTRDCWAEPLSQPLGSFTVYASCCSGPEATWIRFMMATGVINTNMCNAPGTCSAVSVSSSCRSRYRAGRCCQKPHSKEKAQKSVITHPKPQSWEVAEPGCNLWEPYKYRYPLKKELQDSGPATPCGCRFTKSVKTSKNQKDLVDKFNQHEAEPDSACPHPILSPALPHPTQGCVVAVFPSHRMRNAV